MVEASYVGTRGRDLVSRSNGNVMPYGVMNSGTFNGVDLSNPVNRVAVASVSDNLASFRPFNALSGITLYDFNGVSNYDSMQVTLSRQTGRQAAVLRRLHARPEPAARSAANTRIIDPYDPNRTYGVLAADRTHVLNVSWNAFLPDGAKGGMDNAVGRGPPERLAGVGHLVAGQRHPDPS